LELAQTALPLVEPHWLPETIFPYQPTPEHCLGLAYLKKGDYKRAIECLEEAARRRPGRVLIQEHLQQAREEQLAARKR